jgi:hypothetical protein
LQIQHDLGQEVDEDRCPPDTDDFPLIAIEAIDIFNLLGDRVYPEIGYVGKDYTNLKVLIDLYKIDNVELLMLLLAKLDSHVIKSSQDKLKREYDRMKNKSRGR